MIRQGDLFFIPCKNIPLEAIVQQDGIIARGEVTGHTHRISTGKAFLMLCAGIAYVRAETEALIGHEEHKPVTLPPGNWLVKRQREYQPQGWRQIAD